MSKIKINKFFALSICLSVMAFEMVAQTKYWVTFTDKNNSPYSINNPNAYLSAKSVIRRMLYTIPIDQSDLPVNSTYINAVAAIPGVTVMYASKWINGVVISTSNPLNINIINNFSFVSSSSVVNRYKLQSELTVEEPISLMGKSEAVSTPSSYYGGAYWQAKQLGVDCLHNQGFKGQGMTIAVLDAGFNNVGTNPVFDSLRNRGGILGTRDFVAGGTSVYEDDSHGALVLSCMAGIKPNFIYGTAPRADYWLLRTEEAATEKIIEEYNWIRGAEFADSVGADILNTSLGYTTFDNPAQNHTYAHLDGRTSKMSIASTMAARKGIFVLNSAGNGGGGSWPKIGIPADADSICTVGAIDSLYNIAGFSSVGPTADGRIKPDLVARGSKAWVAFTNGSCGYSNGTSFSCPILAGAVACFWQAHKSYNNIKVLDTLRHTASFSLTPNNIRGWGTTNMCLIAPAPPDLVGFAENSSLQNSFKVMPNPFNSTFTIDHPAYSNAQFQIIDVLGKTVLRGQTSTNSDKTEVNLTEIPDGVYFIKLSSEEGHSIKKIIKQH